MKNDFIMVVLALIATGILLFALHLGGYKQNGLDGFICYSLFYIMFKLEYLLSKVKDK